jgi:excisionase family DNA binding protein
MQLTLGQAASQAGISKSYFSKLIKTGKISAERQPNGEWRIDPSELDRLPHILSRQHRKNVQSEHTDTPIEHTSWQGERDVLLALLRDREQQIQDLRQDRDAWRVQAEHLLLVAPTKSKPRWWEVFFRGFRSPH